MYKLGRVIGPLSNGQASLARIAFLQLFEEDSACVIVAEGLRGDSIKPRRRTARGARWIIR